MFKRKSVDVEDALRRSQNGSLLVDVRQAHELRDGKAKGALHIPQQDLFGRIDELEGEEVLVICRSGNRSGRSAAMLRRQGVEAHNVRGGMLAWIRSGLPTQRA